MPVGTGLLLGGVYQGIKKLGAANRASDLADADAYRQALQKATYASLGPEFSQGLDRIQGYLAGAGPLADSGARARLGLGLASSVYGRAAGQIGQGYASYLANVLNQRRQFAYQQALIKAQAKANKKGPLDYLAAGIGGAASGFIPGLGAARRPTFGNDFGGSMPGWYPSGDVIG